MQGVATGMDFLCRASVKVLGVKEFKGLLRECRMNKKAEVRSGTEHEQPDPQHLKADLYE